jgi:hypothetical protein
LAHAHNHYFLHPEIKAAHGRTAGEVGVRSISLSSIELVGKETNQKKVMASDETNGIVGGRETGRAQVYGVDGIGMTRNYAAMLKPYASVDLTLATGLGHNAIEKIRNGKTKHPDDATVRALLSGLPLLDPDRPRNILGWRDLPNSLLAQVLGTDDVADIRSIKRGRRHLSDDERLRLITGIQAALSEQQQADCEEPSDSTSFAGKAESDALPALDEMWSQADEPRIPTYTLAEIVRRELAHYIGVQAG